MKFHLAERSFPPPRNEQVDRPPSLQELTADLSAGAGKAAEDLDAAFGELAALTFRSECPESATGSPLPGDFRPAKFTAKRGTPA